MGFFKNLFGKEKPDLPAEAVWDSEKITFYDEKGREVIFSKSQWKNTVLPGLFKKNWDNPDELYKNIFMAVADGFFELAMPACQRLISIDPDKARSNSSLARALHAKGDSSTAVKTLDEFLRQNGPEPLALTNLGIICWQSGHLNKAAKAFWDALKLDPNPEDTVDCWAKVNFEMGGEPAKIKALKQLAQLEGAWRGLANLGFECLKKKDLAGAKKYYSQVMEKFGDDPDVLYVVSGDLGNSGCPEEMLSLVAPRYKPEDNRPETGLNMLQAYLDTGNYEQGQKLMKQLFFTLPNEYKQHLITFSSEFAKLKFSGKI